MVYWQNQQPIYRQNGTYTSIVCLAYDPLHPLVCFDERPCFLIDDIVEPIALQSGKPRKEHYAYEKLGSCALLAAIEPLTGKRIAQVYGR